MTKQDSLGISAFDAAKYLKDEESVAAFLNASIEMKDPAVLMNAVSTVARARSMTQLAEASGLGRESLYKALKPGATPRYDTVMKVLGALGVEMVFRAPVAPAIAAQKARAVPAKKAVPVTKRAPRTPVEARASASDGKKSASLAALKRRG